MRKIATIVNPSTTGKGINPFSKKNLPSPKYQIPSADLTNLYKLTKDLSRKDTMLFFKKVNKEFLISVSTNKKDYLKYRKNLISTVKEFTGHESPSFNTFDYNKFSALFLSKLNTYLNETNQYVFSLENKIKELENHINAQNELINQMENSNSWKLTKPLRNIRKR